MLRRRTTPTRPLTALGIGALLLATAACGSASAGADRSAETSRTGGAGGGGGMDMGAAAACPAPPELAAVPERVVTMDTGAAAILVELGLGDRIVGTSGTDFSADFDGELRAELDAIPVLGRRAADRETVVAAEPDLVTGVSVYEFGSFDGTASVDQLAAAGAASLVACDVTAGDATTDLEDTYAYVRALATAFDVEPVGVELVARLQDQVTAATASYTGQAPVRVLTLSSAPEGGQGINTSGGSSLANGIITAAGGENIASDVLSDFAQLSTEVVAVRDPEAIVAVSGIGGGTADDLVAAIRSSPALATTTAVREDRIVVVSQTGMLSPSLVNAATVADIATGIHRPAA